MRKLSIAVLIALLLAACGETKKETHFINDAAYREQVEKQFAVRKEMAENRDEALFGVFKKELSNEQREALMFLYAYMPLNDLADYDGEFFLKQVNTALATREAFEWGKTIPEDIFRHFVLPYRVSNESLDTARMLFFNDLKVRLQGMSMYDAALEVNHWCHERVIYQASDSRTSSPLASARTAHARCGEETVFTITALRAAGIPARHVFTPRWAHTDDNHAWVEVWVDGQWYYMGACEPEPALNMAWFSAPAKRAMMVQSSAFGEYSGKEDVMLKSAIYSRISMLDIYAPTKILEVKVLDDKDNPLDNIEVKFQLYNYGEFFSLTSKTTDDKGLTQLETGFGDLMVWVSNGTNYGYMKVDKDVTAVTISLSREQGEEYAEEIDINPPVPLKKNDVSTDKERENNGRLKYEDSIRNAYIATFPKKEASDEFAKKNGLPADKTWAVIEKSLGNWQEMYKFMELNKDNKYLFDILNAVSDKDLRDTPADVLTDHLRHSEKRDVYANDIYVQYVLNPRVRNELITPWREFFYTELHTHARENVNAIIDWIKNNISINTADVYFNGPISPVGVFNLRIADKVSRNVFFVAVCRTSGIAARINTATDIPQVYENNKWVNIDFDGVVEKPIENAGNLVLNNSPKNSLIPRYKINYTIAHFINGSFVTLNYKDIKLPATIDLEEGYYKLLTSNRADDGSVLLNTNYFNIKANKTRKMDVEVRPITKSFEKKATVSLQHTLEKFADNTALNLQTMAQGKGLILVFIDPNREPSQHVMNDIPLQQTNLEKWGGNILFVLPDDKTDDFDAARYKGLPSQSIVAIDKNRAVMNALFVEMKEEFIGDFPVIWLFTPQGEIVFMWQGYRIGIGDDLLKAIMANNLY